MTLSPLAGKPAPRDLLIDPARIGANITRGRPDVHRCPQRLPSERATSRFAIDGSFNEAHISAITQAICDYRRRKGHLRTRVHGPRYARRFRPAQRTALEVLAANGVETLIQTGDGFTPTPAISRRIRSQPDRSDRLATASSSPRHPIPRKMAVQYNPPNGGPARAIGRAGSQARANAR